MNWFCQLRYDKLGEEWWVVTREKFDLVRMGEPFLGLVMLININSLEYILRVLGYTR